MVVKSNRSPPKDRQINHITLASCNKPYRRRRRNLMQGALPPALLVSASAWSSCECNCPRRVHPAAARATGRGFTDGYVACIRRQVNTHPVQSLRISVFCGLDLVHVYRPDQLGKSGHDRNAHVAASVSHPTQCKVSPEELTSCMVSSQIRNVHVMS